MTAGLILNFWQDHGRKKIYLSTEWSDLLLSGFLRLPLVERFGAHRAQLQRKPFL